MAHRTVRTVSDKEQIVSTAGQGSSGQNPNSQGAHARGPNPTNESGVYAIIRTGGKQYRVTPGDTVRVEKLEKGLGDTFDLTDVLLISGSGQTHVAEPGTKGSKVTVTVVRQDRSPKVIVFKKKRRQGYRKMRGHRQLYTELFVQSIVTPDGKVATAESKAHIIDPVKTAARKEQAKIERQAKAEAARKEARAAGISGREARAVAKKATRKIKPALKAKAGAKKATGRKPAKKAAGKSQSKSKK